MHFSTVSRPHGDERARSSSPPLRRLQHHFSTPEHLTAPLRQRHRAGRNRVREVLRVASGRRSEALVGLGDAFEAARSGDAEVASERSNFDSNSAQWGDSNFAPQLTRQCMRPVLSAGESPGEFCRRRLRRTHRHFIVGAMKTMNLLLPGIVISLAVAARLLAVRPWTLRAWGDVGVGPHPTPGGWFQLDEVLRWRAEQLAQMRIAGAYVDQTSVTLSGSGRSCSLDNQ